ncbi:MAG: 4-diphosphocytidyl-2-C-methyl-D-erythritol kinase [Sphingomonas bacterium]|uniref:4-(cytidine 5'-diphospho)-2-C-methyl-D-erythritol kinase n=1 Tax=Sphingomonas bacterium TaxID=1895847 RepID=UPI002622C6F6|nr:4-(cytidine 5'-diphospho)-2-C-methyl-D-erythritol kinase [Sphingomonas bacterium]MDB5704658.1 4-diphosphocytidyl-2-C-methyl-D-erythritol kinase [Sphingomonas bacterium]
MIVEQASAKINLALHVRSRRDDGYHEIETLFAFLKDGDELQLAPGPASFALEGPFAAALEGESGNLVTRAAASYASALSVPDKGAFTLVKRLPVASGIGGGSADAAAALRALARRDGVALDDPRLFAVAEALGSDVPACLFRRSALGRGRGEELEPLEGLAGMPVLLVNPGVAVSTASVFAAWSGKDRGPIGDGALLGRALLGRNDLEAPARSIAPVIGEVLALLLDTRGTRLVRMSGSGATCFALYDHAADRAAAHQAISAARPGWWCLESALA